MLIIYVEDTLNIYYIYGFFISRNLYSLKSKPKNIDFPQKIILVISSKLSILSLTINDFK